MMSVVESPRRWDGTGMPLPNLPQLVTEDIDAVHQHMSAMFCRHELRTEGGHPPLVFRHHQACLKSITFNATDYGHAFGQVVTSIPPTDTLFLVQISLCGLAQITQDGKTFDLQRGQMCVLGPDARVKQVFHQGYKHLTIKIDRSDLEAVLARELGFRPGEALRFSPCPVPLEGTAAAFAHLVRTICDDLDRGASGFSHARTGSSVAEAVLSLLLAAVPHNHSGSFDAPAIGPAPYYVRRVEELVHHRACEPIELADMIAASGVSARSLHAGFRRFRDTTPMIYLKNHRLDLAHRQLRAGADQGLSVTEVALDCGFTHLSKFAHSYRERFGEHPSATLKHLGRR